MWREFLTLSKREQTGVLSLFFLLIILIGLLWLKPAYRVEKVDEELQAWVDQINKANPIVTSNKVQPEGVNYFVFNPDEVSKDDLLKLGFSEYASENLIKYRTAGGKITSFEKLSQIYGMDSVHLEEIESYVIFSPEKNLSQENKISSPRSNFKVDLNIQDSNDLVKLKLKIAIIKDILQTQNEFYFNQRLSVSELQKWNLADWESVKDTILIRKRSEVIMADQFLIELNSADTAELSLLRGIGKVLANRIVYYRNRLGGFYDLEQLAEVEGISPIVLADNKEYIIIDTLLVKKVNINNASLKRMKDHPYMDFYMAKDIYESRKKSTVYLKDVVELESFAKSDKNRIRQYFTDNR